MRAVLLLLGELSDHDVHWLLKAGNSEEISPGTVLIQEGEKVDALYVVMTGKLTVSISQSSDDVMTSVYAALEDEIPQQELAKLSCGEVIGEMSLMDTRPHSTTVQAAESSIVLAIPRQKLMSKLEQDTGFAVRFYRALASVLTDRLRNTVSRLRYRKGQPLAEGVEYEDELDQTVLEQLALAGTKFAWLLQQIKSD